MFPCEISSRRERVDPATSGTSAPAAGAGGDSEGGGGSCDEAPGASAAAPGETPSPAFPGAAPSCGAGGGCPPGEDELTPGTPSPLASMMFWRAAAPFAINSPRSLRSCTFKRLRGPHSGVGLLVGTLGWAARRTPGSTRSGPTLRSRRGTGPKSGRAAATGDGARPRCCRQAVVCGAPLDVSGDDGALGGSRGYKGPAAPLSSSSARAGRGRLVPSHSTAVDLNQQMA